MWVCKEGDETIMRPDLRQKNNECYLPTAYIFHYSIWFGLFAHEHQAVNIIPKDCYCAYTNEIST